MMKKDSWEGCAMAGSGRSVWKSCGLLVVLAMLSAPANEAPAAARGVAATGPDSFLHALDAASIKSISAWIKASGKDGYLAADVADAAGIPRTQAEEVLEARQRGFKSGNVLRIAQIPADDRRDFLLFMVQRPDGEVFFYLSTVKEGLKKAFVSIPGRNAVLPLEFTEAQAAFQQEIHYWEARIAARQ
jgi:hypothetical protein